MLFRSWNCLEYMPKTRFCSSSAIINNKVYLFGGMYGDEDCLAHHSVAVYDLESERFEQSIMLENTNNTVKVVPVAVPKSYWVNKFCE